MKKFIILGVTAIILGVIIYAWWNYKVGVKCSNYELEIKAKMDATKVYFSEKTQIVKQIAEVIGKDEEAVIEEIRAQNESMFGPGGAQQVFLSIVEGSGIRTRNKDLYNKIVQNIEAGTKQFNAEQISLRDQVLAYEKYRNPATITGGRARSKGYPTQQYLDLRADQLVQDRSTNETYDSDEREYQDEEIFK